MSNAALVLAMAAVWCLLLAGAVAAHEAARSLKRREFWRRIMAGLIGFGHAPTRGRQAMARRIKPGELRQAQRFTEPVETFPAPARPPVENLDELLARIDEDHANENGDTP